jgi:hypothetical protein
VSELDVDEDKDEAVGSDGDAPTEAEESAAGDETCERSTSMPGESNEEEVVDDDNCDV